VALICARCGTDNPAEDAFCMSCGAQLVAGAPPTAGAQLGAGSPPSAGVPLADAPTESFTLDTPPVVTPAPVVAPAPAAMPPGYDPSQPGVAVPSSFLPPGYVPGASPYLPAPPSGSPPVHRMSSTMIIAIVVIVLLVVGGGGVAYAALHKGGTTATVNGNVPVHVPTTAPTASPTQPPATTPVPTPATTTGGGQRLSTAFASVFVPTGYTVSDQESDYVILTPANGDDEAIGVQAEPLTDTTTNAQLDQGILAGDQQSDDPSARFCSTKAPSQTQVVGSSGPITADVISICESLSPSNAAAFTAVDGYIDGVAKASDGSFKAVWFEILAPATSFQAFTNSIPSSLFTQTTFTDAGPNS
jgi:hypothetical protein